MPMTISTEKNRQYIKKWRETHKEEYLLKQRAYTAAWRERNREDYLAAKTLNARISNLHKVRPDLSKEWLRVSFEFLQILHP